MRKRKEKRYHDEGGLAFGSLAIAIFSQKGKCRRK